MEKILKEIQGGSFAKEYIEECEKGNPRLTKFRQENAASLVEKIGEQLRAMMPWLQGSVQKKEQHTGQTISQLVGAKEPAKK